MNITIKFLVQTYEYSPCQQFLIYTFYLKFLFSFHFGNARSAYEPSISKICAEYSEAFQFHCGVDRLGKFCIKSCTKFQIAIFGLFGNTCGAYDPSINKIFFEYREAIQFHCSVDRLGKFCIKSYTNIRRLYR